MGGGGGGHGHLGTASVMLAFTFIPCYKGSACKQANKKENSTTKLLNSKLCSCRRTCFEFCFSTAALLGCGPLEDDCKM